MTNKKQIFIEINNPTLTEYIELTKYYLEISEMIIDKFNDKQLMKELVFVRKKLKSILSMTIQF